MSSSRYMRPPCKTIHKEYIPGYNFTYQMMTTYTSSLERFLQMRRIWESDSFIISWCNFCYRSWITDKNLNFNLERKIGVYLIHSISQMTAKFPPVGFAKNYRLLKSLYEYIIKKIVFLKNTGLRNKRWRIRYIVIKIANPLTNFPNLLLLLLV